MRGEGPRPCYKIDLCFGEEFPEAGVPKGKRLITAQVSVCGGDKDWTVTGSVRWIKYTLLKYVL